MVLYHHTKNHPKRSNGSWDIQIWKIEQSDWPRAFNQNNSRTRFFPDMGLVPLDAVPFDLTFATLWTKTNDSILNYYRKSPFWAHFDPLFPKKGKTGFFPKNRAPSLFCVYWTLTSCKKSEKTNEPILRKTRNWQTDRQTGGREFIGPCR